MVHILNGDSAAGSFKKAFHIPNEEILVFRDVLSCGALEEYSGIEAWFGQRRSYWANMCAEHGFSSVDDVHQAPSDFYTNVNRLKNADEVTLWIGCALSDQLLMVFVVTLFKFYGLDFRRLNIRQFLTFDHRESFVIGLGMLNPEKIKVLNPEAVTFDDAQITFCLEVWHAVVSTSPQNLMGILRSVGVRLPLLHKALQNFLYRYPNTTNGLSRFDEIILSAAKDHGPSAARIMGYTLGYDMHCDHDDENIFI